MIDPERVYYGIDGQRYGPVTLTELRQRIEQGEVGTGDFLWDDDDDDWVPIENFTELIGELPQSYEFAGFTVRLVAHVLDAVVLWGITVLILGFDDVMEFGRIVMEDSMAPNQLSDAQAELVTKTYGVMLLLEWAYNAILVSSKWQATVGKKLVGLRVVDLDGTRVSFFRATLRHILKIVSQLIFYLGFVWIFFSPERQAMHDRLGGTLVLRRE